MLSRKYKITIGQQTIANPVGGYSVCVTGDQTKEDFDLSLGCRIIDCSFGVC
ncbi:MAG: hypothetical protein ACJAR3_002716 [Roseivirga sp.]|jgi:hypothetical protein